MKPEFLMLGHTYKPAKQGIAGWFVSEKLDGVRAFWDGGLSRGLPASEVPYANTIKDHRLITPPIATGLWSRTGKVIYAPNWWLDQLLPIPLDGELWLGRGGFQKLTSIVSEHTASPDWQYVRYMAFDSPPFMRVFQDRTVKVRDYDFEIRGGLAWYMERLDIRYSDLLIKSASTKWTFEMVHDWLCRQDFGGSARMIGQERLPFNHQEAIARIQEKLDDLLFEGGEGIILRKPTSFWEPHRSHYLLKHKPWKDDEAIITGFTSGRETDRGSKLLGMIGALIVDYKGKRLELSGLTHDERRFKQLYQGEFAATHSGEDMPSDFEGAHFKVGDKITFKYRELSDAGVPKEARFFRQRGVE